MDFLVELLIEIFGGVIEILFGEVPLRKLPKPLRFVILFVFWFGLSMLFFWFSSLAFSEMRVLSLIFFAAAVLFIVLGVYYIFRSMRAKRRDEEKASENSKA